MPSSARARADFLQIKRQSTYRRGVHCAPERGQPQGLSLRITNQMYSVQISRTDKDVRPYAYQMHSLPREILRFAQNDKSAQFVGAGFHARPSKVGFRTKPTATQNPVGVGVRDDPQNPINPCRTTLKVVPYAFIKFTSCCARFFA